MSSIWNYESRPLLVLLCVSFCLRLLIVWGTPLPDSELLSVDAVEYLSIGRNLSEQHIFGVVQNDAFQPEIKRTPVYPLFVAFHHKIFGDLLWPLYLSQSLLSMATCFLVYRLSERIMSSKMAFWTALILALDPAQVYFSILPLTETLFTFFLVLGVYLLAKSYESFSWNPFIVSAFFLALSALTRPISLFICIPILPFLFCFPGDIRSRILKTGCWLLVFAFPLCLWMTRNYLYVKVPALSTISAINLYHYRAAGIKSKLEKIPLTEAQARLAQEFSQYCRGKELSEKEKINFLSSVGREYIIHHPFLYSFVHLEGTARLLFGPSFRYICWRLGYPLPTLGILTMIQDAR